MISAEDAMNRALKAIELVAATFGEDEDQIFAEIKDAIRAEFAADDDWKVVEIKPDLYAIQSTKTGEFYRAKTRGDGRRLVTFRFADRAQLVANMRNMK